MKSASLPHNVYFVSWMLVNVSAGSMTAVLAVLAVWQYSMNSTNETKA
jgi:hypothetical protein